MRMGCFPIISLLLACIIMASCMMSPGGKNEDAGFQVEDVKAANLINARHATVSPNAKEVASGANEFAFALTSALLNKSGDINFVCSPFSAWLPLAALVNATDEKHRPALQLALGAAGVSADEINEAASRMLYDMTKTDGVRSGFLNDP